MRGAADKLEESVAFGRVGIAVVLDHEVGAAVVRDMAHLVAKRRGGDRETEAVWHVAATAALGALGLELGDDAGRGGHLIELLRGVVVEGGVGLPQVQRPVALLPLQSDLAGFGKHGRAVVVLAHASREHHVEARVGITCCRAREVVDLPQLRLALLL